MLSAWKVGDRGFELRSGIQVSKKQNISSLRTRNDSILWGASWQRISELGLRPPGLEFRILCWRAVTFYLSHHHQEVLLAKFSLYMHKGGLKPHWFHLYRDGTTSILHKLVHTDIQWVQCIQYPMIQVIWIKTKTIGLESLRTIIFN